MVRTVLERDAHTCTLRLPMCTGVATEVDHIVRGDDHSMINLRAVCRACHHVKTRGEALAMRQHTARPAERHPGLT